MPAVSRGNEHGVDSLFCKQVPEVWISPAILVLIAVIDGLLCTAQTVIAAITYRNPLDFLKSEKVGKNGLRTITYANRTKCDSVIRGDGTIKAENGTVENQRDGKGRTCLTQ